MPRDVAVQGGCSWSAPSPLDSCFYPVLPCWRRGSRRWVFQVGRMVVVQGEPLPVVLAGSSTLGVEGGQPCRPVASSLGAGVLVVGECRAGPRPAGSGTSGAGGARSCPAPPGLPSRRRRRAPRIRPTFLFVQAHHRGQIGHAGQGHPGSYFQQASFIVVQRLPRRHRRTSGLPWDKSRWLVPTAGKPEPGSGARPTGPLCGSPAALLGDAPLYVPGSGLMVLGSSNT